MELHHLHVLERDSGAQRQRHPVARARVRVRGARIEPPGAAGREDDRLRADRHEAAVDEVPRDDALAAVVVDDEFPREVLLVRADVALHHLLVEHVDEDVAQMSAAYAVRGSPAAPNGRWAIRPSGVLEKTAPQCSSSYTSPGASLHRISIASWSPR